jgi:hypothetical protein
MPLQPDGSWLLVDDQSAAWGDWMTMTATPYATDTRCRHCTSLQVSRVRCVPPTGTRVAHAHLYYMACGCEWLEELSNAEMRAVAP